MHEENFTLFYIYLIQKAQIELSYKIYRLGPEIAADRIRLAYPNTSRRN